MNISVLLQWVFEEIDITKIDDATQIYYRDTPC